MGNLTEVWLQIVSVIRTVRPADIIDIVCVAYLVYKVISWTKENRASQLSKGIVVLLVGYLISMWMQLQTINVVLGYILGNGLLLLAVIFQPELRRMLEQVGRSQLSKFDIFSLRSSEEQALAKLWRGAITGICDAVRTLSREKVGALMVIEQKTRLGDIIDTGTTVDSALSPELVRNIFFPNSPLHDGAMIIRDGKIHAAGCFLPLSDNHDINKQLGTRHRAALGMSENSDALIIVVSEETGTISVAEKGQLTRDYDWPELQQLLEEKLLPAKEKPGESDRKFVFWREKK